MKFTRSALAVLAAFVMLLTVLPASAQNADLRANEGPLTIAVGSVSGSYGHTVDVPVTLSCEGGFEANTIQFVAQYNRLALRLTGAVRGGLLSGLTGAEVTIDTRSHPGNVYVCILCTGGGITESGTLLTLRFSVLTEEYVTSPITLFHGAASYYPIGGAEQDIPVELVNGSVTVVDPPQYPYGDANLDGELSFADISAMYAIILGGEDVPASLVDIADFNRDGTLSFGDISALYNHLIQS